MESNENQKEICPSCSYPAQAGHAPDCPLRDSAAVEEEGDHEQEQRSIVLDFARAVSDYAAMGIDIEDRNSEARETAKIELISRAQQMGLGSIDPSLNHNQAGAELAKMAYVLLVSDAPPTELRDKNKNEPFEGTRGRVVLDTQFAKVQVTDAENEMGKDTAVQNLVKIIVDQASAFRGGPESRFKADLVIHKGTLAMRTDLGNHKEYLALAVGDRYGNAHALWYQHLPSGYETGNPENQQRFRYVHDLVRQISLRYAKSEYITANPKTKTVESFVASKDFRVLERLLPNYVRLMHSVKNLDIALSPSEVDFAERMFEAGVTNMQSFLDVVHQSTREDVDPRKHATLLNDEEIQLAEKCIAYDHSVRENKADIKESLQYLREAKDLNYEIIELLRILENLGRQALAASEPSPKLAAEINKTYRATARGITKMYELISRGGGMTHSIHSRSGDIEVGRFIQEFWPAVEQMSNIARFGYGSPDIRQTERGDLDVQSADFKNVPETARKAYEQYQTLFSDKGKNLRGAGDVESIEEVVRFLHASIVRSTQSFSYHAKDLVNSRFARETQPVDGIGVIDVTSGGLKNSAIHRTFYTNTIAKLGKQARLFFSMEDQSPVAIIGDDYAEFSFPGGKHYIEFTVNTHDTPPDYNISIRYIESGYDGALARQDFTTEALESMGFVVTRNRDSRGKLQAYKQVTDKREWEHNFTDTVRLAISLKNLDLGSIAPGTARYFTEGAMARNVPSFKELEVAIEYKYLNAEVSDFVKRTMRDGNVFEMRLLVKTLAEKTRNFNVLKLYLENLDHLDLDRIITSLYELSDRYKDAKNVNMSRKYNRIAKKVIDYMDSKFFGKE